MSSCIAQTSGPAIANLLSSFLSFVGTAFVISTVFTTRKLDPVSKVIFFLSFTDLLASLTIFTSQSHLLIGPYSTQACIAYRSFIQLFIVSSFFWTSCVALQIYLEVKYLGRFKHNRMCLVGYVIVCLFIPLIFVIVDVSSNAIQPSSLGFCSNLMDFQLGLWYSPMVLSWIWNFVLYVLISKEVWKSLRAIQKEDTQEYDDKTEIKVALKLASMQLIFIFCWAVDFGNHIAMYFFATCPGEALLVLQNLTPPLQGFLNSIIYGLAKKNIRRSFLDMICCGRRKIITEETI